MSDEERVVRDGGNRSGKTHQTMHLQFDDFEREFGWRPPCPLCPPIAIDPSDPFGEGTEG